MKACDKPVSLLEFWREFIESGTKNAKCRICGWTNVRGTDIAVIERDGKNSRPITMTDETGSGVLSDKVRTLYEEDNLVFLFFHYHVAKVIVLATQSTEGNSVRCYKRKDRLYSRLLSP
jgi:hypothetical protein